MAGRRKAHYTVRIADMICEYIAEGRTLEKALAKVGPLGPSTVTTVYRWLDLYPEFREKYERARQLQADIDADTIRDLAEEVLKKPREANAFRVSADLLKWQAEVRNPGKYGKSMDDKGKNKPMDPSKIREEIKRLESELGIVEKKANVTPLKKAKKA
jgi:hypothetical protein